MRRVKVTSIWSSIWKIARRCVTQSKAVAQSPMLVQVGRLENAIGWYHSHPGYGCWLSGIDVNTQLNNQSYQDPFVAVVVRSTSRSLSARRRTLEYMPISITSRTSRSSNQALTMTSLLCFETSIEPTCTVRAYWYQYVFHLDLRLRSVYRTRHTLFRN